MHLLQNSLAGMTAFSVAASLATASSTEEERRDLWPEIYSLAETKCGLELASFLADSEPSDLWIRQPRITAPSGSEQDAWIPVLAWEMVVVVAADTGMRAERFALNKLTEAERAEIAISLGKSLTLADCLSPSNAEIDLVPFVEGSIGYDREMVRSSRCTVASARTNLEFLKAYPELSGEEGEERVEDLVYDRQAPATPVEARIKQLLSERFAACTKES